MQTRVELLRSGRLEEAATHPSLVDFDKGAAVGDDDFFHRDLRSLNFRIMT